MSPSSTCLLNNSRDNWDQTVGKINDEGNCGEHISCNEHISFYKSTFVLGFGRKRSEANLEETVHDSLFERKY